MTPEQLAATHTGGGIRARPSPVDGQETGGRARSVEL